MLKKGIGAICAGLLVFTLFIGGAFAATARSQVLMRGDRDEWVTELQEALHEKGYLKVNPTGYFGTDTQAAVMAFQKDGNITVDGKAGPVTRKLLLGDNFREIDENRLNGSNNEDNLDFSTLRQGDRGDDVTKVQERLKELEYYDYSKITGYFGTITRDSVIKFQRTHNLTADGTVDEATKNLMFSSSAKYYMMRRGDSGEDIRDLQNRLKELGYFNSTATGYYGSITKQAAIDFQKNHGLTADGIVGKNTRAILFSDDAKPADGKPSNGNAAQEPGDDADSEEPAEQTGVEKFISVAEGRLGKAYVYGAEGPNTFDCSGLVYYSLRNAGVKISRLSSRGYAAVSSWDDVDSMDDLKRGDLIFFKSDTSSTISHVAIYLGDNQMIHAVPSSGAVVKASLSTSYWTRNFVSGKRVF